MEGCAGIASQRLNEEPSPEAQEISLDELGSVYGSLTQTRGKDPLLRVVSLQDRLMAQFPEVSSQLLFVKLKRLERPREALSFVPRLGWSGPDCGPLSAWRFLAGEIQSAWWLLIPVFGGTLITLSLLQDVELMASLNRLALTSLSIFVVFVIGESKWLSNRIDLFRSGRLHEFLDADRMMIRVAILALLLAFANAAVLQSPADPEVMDGVERSHALGPALTTIVMVLLIDLFLAIPRYYLRRLRTMVERDAIKEILVRTGDKPMRSVPPAGIDNGS